MYAIRAIRLFDGVADSLTAQPTVLVEDGRIVAVQADPPPTDIDVIDLGDATLLPGLVDAHQHLVFDATDDPVGHLAGRDDQAVLIQARAAARSALEAGITTVRDLGDRRFVLLRLREELSADVTAGPRLLLAGPPITTHKGHCWFLGDEAEGVAGARAAVRERAARGVDVVKIMVSGGALTPGSVTHASQYGPAELQAAADEAHRLGLTVTGHAWGAQGIADAVAAGFDGLEHCGFFTPDGVSADPAVIEAMATNHVFVSSTGATTGPLAESVYDAEILKRLPDIITAYEQMRAAGVPIVMSSDDGVTRPSRTTSYRMALPCSPGWATPTPTPSAPSPPGPRPRAASATGQAAWRSATTPISSPSQVTHSTTSTRYSRSSRCSAAASASSSAKALSVVGGRRLPVRLADR